ncbi:hypothetical protein [Lacibacter sp.]|uniref:hypothetical protein n=1 Tax=Lacibacter sp. TaxID=1915409 RepID=UPI002B4B7D6B|nr:hypothetical protein [Lacibacter sp.]HLP39497.1 hypothetical protein [Lacibacter sp.]
MKLNPGFGIVLSREQQKFVMGGPMSTCNGEIEYVCKSSYTVEGCSGCTYADPPDYTFTECWMACANEIPAGAENCKPRNWSTAWAGC